MEEDFYNVNNFEKLIYSHKRKRVSFRLTPERSSERKRPSSARYNNPFKGVGAKKLISKRVKTKT